MRQPSLFSAQASVASPEDLAGLLCAPGQVHGFGRGTAARVSTVVAAFVAGLLPLATEWTRGAVKAVPR